LIVTEEFVAHANTRRQKHVRVYFISFFFLDNSFHLFVLNVGVWVGAEEGGGCLRGVWGLRTERGFCTQVPQCMELNGVEESRWVGGV